MKTKLLFLILLTPFFLEGCSNILNAWDVNFSGPEAIVFVISFFLMLLGGFIDPLKKGRKYLFWNKIAFFLIAIGISGMLGIIFWNVIA